MVALAPPDIRAAIIDGALPALGIVMSPEFRAALEPHPKEKIVLGGVRGGKSTLGATELQIAIIEYSLKPRPEPELYWIILPSYRANHSLAEYVLRWTHGSGLLDEKNISTPKDSPWRLPFFGGKLVIETRTAQDLPAIAGAECHGIVIDEPGQMAAEVQERARERTLTTGGWVVMTGTLENDLASPQFVWYGDLGREWLMHPTADHMAFSLPTWANLAKFPGGRNDPLILAEEKTWVDAGKAYKFNRRIAGIPDGVQDPVYDDILSTGDFGAGSLDGWTPIRSLGAGGYDAGTTQAHPAALVVCQRDRLDVAIVRDVWTDTQQAAQLVEDRRLMMSQLWHIDRRNWGFDPQLKIAAGLVEAEAVSMASRMYRVGLVDSRLRQNKLRFDMDVQPHDDEATTQRKHRVRRLFDQMRRVHYIRRELPGKGLVLEYNRVDDDMAAALEDAIEVMDSKKRTNWGGYDPQKAARR